MVVSSADRTAPFTASEAAARYARSVNERAVGCAGFAQRDYADECIAGHLGL